jgi:membrane protease YdiL (CAAX protease family)
MALIWGILATLPLLLGLRGMLGLQRGPIRELVDLVVAQFGPLLAPLSFPELAILAAVAGLSEEVLFRGVVLVALMEWTWAGWALLASSLLFGLVHFASRTYALLAGVMGLYLGALFLAQGNLLAPAITHALYDLAALASIARLARRRSLAAAG